MRAPLPLALLLAPLALRAQEARPTPVAPVTVVAPATSGSARLADYERRKESGRGFFITRAEIERRRPVELADVLRRVPSLTIMDSLGARLPVSTRGRKLVLRARVADPQAPCVMRVGVDGQVKEPGFGLNMVSPRDVEGIEVYAGPAAIPAELGGARLDAYCGLVMIWTRDR